MRQVRTSSPSLIWTGSEYIDANKLIIGMPDEQIDYWTVVVAGETTPRGSAASSSKVTRRWGLGAVLDGNWISLFM